MWSFHPLGGRAWLAENSLFLSRGRNAFPFAKCARCAARSRTPAIISTAFYRHDPTHAPSLHACHLTTKLKYKSTTLRWRFAAVKKKKKKSFWRENFLYFHSFQGNVNWRRPRGKWPFFYFIQRSHGHLRFRCIVFTCSDPLHNTQNFRANT